MNTNGVDSFALAASTQSPNSFDSRRSPTTSRYVGPPPLMSRAEPRPIMSTSNSATIESIGTVGWSVKYSEPSSPLPSAVCDTSRIERRGLTFPFMNASAISISAIVPLPSSSAPLLIESGRGGVDLAQAVEDRADPRRLLRRRLVRPTVGTERTNDRVERAQRVVIDHAMREADVVVVRRDRDVLAAQRGIAARNDADDVSRQPAPHRRVARRDVRHDLEVAAVLARRLNAETFELRRDVVAGLFAPIACPPHDPSSSRGRTR